MLAIFVLAVGAYLNALPNGFVYDDAPQVVGNPWIRSPKNIAAIFTVGSWVYAGETCNYYRPLMHLVYMATYSLFGLRPWGFHLVNVLGHAGVSLIVLLLGYRIMEGPADRARPAHPHPAPIAALLFATHPVHTEVVAWVAGVPDLSLTLLCLLALYLYAGIPAPRLPSLRPAYLGSLGLFGLALLSKETALVFPAILVAYALASTEDRGKPFVRILGTLPFLLLVPAYLTLRLRALGSFAPAGRHADLAFEQWLVNVPALFGGYLGKLVAPFRLSVFHTFRPLPSLWDARGIAGLAALLAVAALAAVLWRRNRRALFCLCLVVIPLLPVLYVPALGENVFAERYLYLPSAGFVLLFGAAVAALARCLPRQPWVPAGIVLALTSLFAAATIVRNATWKSDLTLWSDAARKSPDSAIVHRNLGLTLLDAGRIEEATGHLETALRIQESPKAWNDLGVTYLRSGRIDEAIGALETGLRLDPDMDRAHQNLALAHLQRRAFREAVEDLGAALRLRPDNAEAHAMLGYCYAMLGLKEEAIRAYQEALKLDPSEGSARASLDALGAR